MKNKRNASAASVTAVKKIQFRRNRANNLFMKDSQV
jgi:hypothetical protein